MVGHKVCTVSDVDENAEIAALLDRVADLLAAQHATGFRVRAYRRGAQSCREEPRALRAILEADGEAGLVALPQIGKSLAASITEILHTGGLPLLDRLEGAVGPEGLFATVAGVGAELAHRIHEQLHLETLEELELAAHDGRLARLEGFGTRRVQQMRDSLAAILSRSSRRRAHRAKQRERPSVEWLLEIDAEYRRRADTGQLRRIAPRRFNPKGEAWLPIWHDERDGWSYTALFSNTARAHELGRTRDWVVIFYEDGGHEEHCTIVTEYHGPLRGQRVVRGRERECAHVR